MQVDDSNPQLSVDAGKLGRLYREPNDVTDYTDYRAKDFITKVYDGTLFPSITTVGNVINAPYLQQWAANLSAKEAVRVGTHWPQNYINKPEKAYNYLRYVHARDLIQAQNRGTRIHRILELLGQGKPLGNLEPLSDDDRACIVSWEKFIKDFSPTFLYQELTGFGVTQSGLKYGGTTDFIANIEGITVAGDYKCSTLDTLILMADGTSKNAGDIVEGDRIVAWTAKRNLHIANVAWTADNGIHDIVSLTTEYGQVLKVTKEHPILVNRKNKLGWVKAGDVIEGDFAHLATGWNHNPHRESTEWNYRVSPYAVGIIWAIINTLVENPTTRKTAFNINPSISKPARKELELLGIKNDSDIAEKRDLISALNRNKNDKDETPFTSLFESANIPQEIFSADVNVQEGFIAGVREIFAVRGKDAKESVINLSSEQAISQLQQLYLNLGVITQREYSIFEKEQKELAEQGLALKVPYFNADEIIKHGPLVAMITRKEITAKESTIAIEVEESHTHVTGGLITHNTTRTGLHNGVAIQLTAFSRTNLILPDNVNSIPTPKIDKAIALHISPDNYKCVAVDISNKSWDIFQSMREMWFYYAFEGKHTPEDNVLGKSLRSGQALLEV
jgi:hypothetical protein